MEWIDNVFEKQLELQKRIKNVDELENVVDMYGAATGMMIEIGEMLQSDTRWKAYITRSKKKAMFDFEQFKEELADVFIYLMNVLIYSGCPLDDFKHEVIYKQLVVKERFDAD